MKIRLRKRIICSETRTKSHHQPNQRAVASANKNARKKFQLFLASVHLKTTKSMFYFRSERIVTKNQKQKTGYLQKVSIKSFYQIHEVEIYGLNQITKTITQNYRT